VAWISCLRWVVLWMWCGARACPVARPVRFWPCPTARPPRSGVSPFARTGQLVEPDSSPLVPRHGHTTSQWPVRDGSGPWRPAGPQDHWTPRCTA